MTNRKIEMKDREKKAKDALCRNRKVKLTKERHGNTEKHMQDAEMK